MALLSVTVAREMSAGTILNVVLAAPVKSPVAVAVAVACAALVTSTLVDQELSKSAAGSV